MRNIKTKIITAGTTFALAGLFSVANPTDTFAAEYDSSNWSARSTSEIKSDIENNSDGSKYTFQWGDTLSAIASATDLSVNKLTEINNINNANVIYAGNSIYLSGDNHIVTVDNNKEVKSYDVSDEKVKEVETPKETQEKIQSKESKQSKSKDKAEAAESEVKETKKKETKNTEEKKTETKKQETKAEAKDSSKEKTANESASSEEKSGNWVTVEATAYSTNEPGLSDTTATGINLNENPRVIAVDPSVIPLGSKVYVPGYGTYIAGDTGGAIKGKRIDIHMTSIDDCYAFGRRTMDIQILD